MAEIKHEGHKTYNKHKSSQKNNFFLTNIIINALSSQSANYIIFLLKAWH